MPAKNNSVKLNDRQWSNLIELNKAVKEAQDAFNVAAGKFQMWIEMQAEQADIAPELKGFEVDPDKKTITYKVPEKQGPQPVE
jgi:hypothetical protein